MRRVSRRCPERCRWRIRLRERRAPASSASPLPKCSPTLAAHQRTADKRKSVPNVTPVFITLDPHRDSCAQVGAYVQDFHPRMIGLTGTPGQVAKVAKAFRVYFADVDRKEDDDDYLGACAAGLRASLGRRSGLCEQCQTYV
jgi:hypothetical protein